MSGAEGVQAKLAAVDQLGSAVGSFARQAVQAGEHAIAIAQKFEDRIVAEHERRVEELKRAKASRETAAAALQACRENCGPLQRALTRAQQIESIATGRADRSAKAIAQVGEALRNFGHDRQSFDDALQRHAPRAKHDVEQISSQLRGYLGSGTRSPSGGSGAAGQDGRSIGRSALAPGMEEVDPQKVINDRSAPLRFEKASRDHVEWGLDRLKTVVEPALRMGKGPEYFASRDKAEGLSGEKSYSGVYNWFYNRDHGIQLTRSSGGYVVSDGYHRLAVARQLGIDSLPAFVR